jgi:hypothetical protein
MAVSIGFGGSFFKSRELRAVIGDENGEQTRYGGCGGAEAHDRSNCAPTKWRKSTQLSRSRRVLRTAGMGHEDQLRPPTLNGGCRLGKATFAGMGGKEEDAPEADFPGTPPEILKFRVRPLSLFLLS